jgi:hypothetical protein
MSEGEVEERDKPEYIQESKSVCGLSGDGRSVSGNTSHRIPDPRISEGPVHNTNTL